MYKRIGNRIVSMLLGAVLLVSQFMSGIEAKAQENAEWISISTAEELVQYVNLKQDMGGHCLEGKYMLLNDIDISNHVDEIAGIFLMEESIFEGNGCTISGMSGSNSLFSNNRGIIKNLTVEGKLVHVTDGYGNINYGGICGFNYGLIENCINKVDINVTTLGMVGGIAGSSNGVIKGCVNEGNLTGMAQLLGGIAGNAMMDILDCDNRGNITLTNDGQNVICNAGGIAGGFASTLIHQDVYHFENCRNSGNLKVLDGENPADIKLGGIIGTAEVMRENTLSSIKNCMNTGDLFGYGKMGGIIGDLDYNITVYQDNGEKIEYGEISVEDSWNSGKITAVGNDSSIGNIVGEARVNNAKVTLKNCIGLGKVQKDPELMLFMFMGTMVGRISSEEENGGTHILLENCQYKGKQLESMETVGMFDENELNVKNCDYSGITFETKENGKLYAYDPEGRSLINQFVCDGKYTYYFQADGTAMRDRLTYHPDGIHVIYFDDNGHEVFSDFANVKKTIAGEAVDDYCFFDVNGYLYVDVVTYDKTGTYLYYANPYGVMDRGRWFEFSENVKWADGTPFDKAGGKYGYANKNGTLLINTWTYDWEGRKCYLQGNGVAVY